MTTDFFCESYVTIEIVTLWIYFIVNSVILYLFVMVLYNFSYNCLFFSVMLILAFEIIVILFTDFSALSGYL